MTDPGTADPGPSDLRDGGTSQPPQDQAASAGSAAGADLDASASSGAGAGPPDRYEPV